MRPSPDAPHSVCAVALLFTMLVCASLLWAALAAADDEATTPGEATRLVGAAIEKFHAGDAAGARVLLGQALQASPGHLGAEQLAAVVCQVLGDQPAALHHYRFIQRFSFPPLPEDATDRLRANRDLLVASEALLVYFANKERLDRKLNAYLPDPRLARIARQHSEEMRDLKYFSHDSPTPGMESIRDRFFKVFEGVQNYGIAENIARRYGEGIFSLTAENVQQTHVDWMESPGHRANLLNTELERIGVGLAMNDNGDYWATQFFARF